MGVAETSSDPQSLVEKLLSCYTIKSPTLLAKTYTQLFDSASRFTDPFVDASPRRESLLQFLALQKIFDEVKVERTSDIKAWNTAEGLNVVEFDCDFTYKWRKNGMFSRWFLPATTQVTASVTLTMNPVTGRIVHHNDAWHAPSASVPKSLRAANAKASNAMFRLLGWEKPVQEYRHDE